MSILTMDYCLSFCYKSEEGEKDEAWTTEDGRYLPVSKAIDFARVSF